MVQYVQCPGLPASWLNAWLAALGVTMLDCRIRLRWSVDATPAAVLVAEGIDPLAALVESWPDQAMLNELPIEERWNDVGRLQRRVGVEAFGERVQAARSHQHSWTLSSTLTDLAVDAKGEVGHAPFDPAGPGTIKWLHHRLLKVHGKVEPSTERLSDTLAGRAERVNDNGLGFDQTRLGSLADGTSMWVDPVVEVLAFFGLAMFPVRGNGIDQRLSRSPVARVVQRGWRQGSGPTWFSWPAWEQALDFAGADALLDAWRPDRKRGWQRLGIHAAWRTAKFEPRGSSDTTRAFASERL